MADKIKRRRFKFALFDKVIKPEGYPFPGVVVAVFTNLSGDERYVVEHDCKGLLHIFNDMQLKKND
jgi:hypothetical protein